jgi:DnaK suppressor protein
VSSSPSVVRPLTANQLSGFKVRLEHELQEARGVEARLREEIVASLESRRSTTTDEVEDPEGSSLAFEGAQTTAMLQQTTRHVGEIEAALERVASGSYGTCVHCGARIASGRLGARPSSPHCIDCAS